MRWVAAATFFVVLTLSCVHSRAGLLHGPCERVGTCQEGECIAWTGSGGRAAGATCEIVCDYERNRDADCPAGFACRMSIDVEGPYTCRPAGRRAEQERRFWESVDGGAR